VDGSGAWAGGQALSQSSCVFVRSPSLPLYAGTDYPHVLIITPSLPLNSSVFQGKVTLLSKGWNLPKH
jgi:hypothetical protein